MNRKSLVNKSIDLPATAPSLSYNLKWVGIKGLECYIYFKPFFKKDPNPTPLLCSVDIYTSLSKDRRGVHLSRLSEELIRLSNTKKTYNIATFCKELADNVRESQEQLYSKVNLTAKHIIKKETTATSKTTLIPLQIGMEVITSENTTRYSSSLSTKTIIVCPCGVEMFRTMLKPNTHINKLDTLYPSHTQRATLKLSVSSSVPISHKKLFEIVMEVTPLLGTTLKRPDEFELLNSIFDNPMFCEDLARITLDKTTKYVEIDETFKIEVSVQSEESIHPYYVVAQGEVLGKGRVLKQ